MADDGPSDELVSQFLAVTGSADASRAVSYLEMSGGNLEMAVSLYMEHTPSTLGGGGSSMSSPQIRAPDATRTMRLMDDTDMIPSHPAYHLMSAMMDEAVVGSAFASPPIHSRHLDARAVLNAAAADSKEDDDDDDDDDDEEFKEDGNDDDDSDVQMLSPGTAAPIPKRLSDMFAAPTHLTHHGGGFQGARTTAKDARRWLLVNLQRDAEFSCHALNRDVWRDELVENLIREGFIFWQTFDTTPEGQTYAERYQVRDYPHVAIIDPRTGRLMWRREGWTQQNPMTAESFAEAAMDFCSRHTFDRPPVAPRPQVDGASSAAAAASRPPKRSMHEMSEDEQLQAAMRASLEEKGDDANKHETVMADDDDDDEIECLGTQPENLKQDEVVIDRPPSFVEQLLAIPSEAEEPPDGARIQLRMPDGKRVARKFLQGAAVKIIYAFVAQTNDDARAGREFVLMAGFPPSDLINNIDDTIESCKLAGQAITVRWK